jgi:hypothetical protein
MKIERETYEGLLRWGGGDSWDSDDELEIDGDRLETILFDYMGKNIRLTIEVIEE